MIRDVAAWGKAWATIHERMGPPAPPLPDIDFTKDMIVVAALGQRGSSGYHILVKDASRPADVITVKVEYTDSVCGAVLTVMRQPVDVAKIPRSVAYVQFEERA